MRWWPALLAVGLSATAYYVSTGLGTFWPAVWLAPLPILLLAFGSSGRVAATLAFVAAGVGSLNLVVYLARLAPLPVVVALPMLTGVTCAMVVLLARYANARLPAWAAALVFPAAWTAIEFATSLGSPHGTFMNLAYTQADVLPLLQLASITGLWGISFVTTLVPSAMAVAWARGVASPLWLAGLCLLATLGFGFARLQQPAAGTSVRVGLAAADQDVGAFDTEDPVRALSVARAHAGRVARLARMGSQVVVLPEKLVGVTPTDAADVQSTFAAAALSARVTLVLGLNRVAVEPPRNVALVFGGDGELRVEYDKHHMLPGPETGYAVGAVPALFSEHGTAWGVAICKDMDFPAWSRRYGQAGARVLVVPAWDFVRDGRLHARMAVVRGVENGFAVVRAAAQGRLTVSDAYGRILAESESGALPDATLGAYVTPGPGRTLYVAAGDWFGWLDSAALVSLLVWAARRSARLPG